ncbi:helix-turn-helix transcriptional regulator [Lysinibacillus sp. FSL K6-0057]|uniref:helix-turn-helix domain-containing protein n=1 Tax=Lysinibacillus sp. FSL K6-0057 TaxID=2921411 RepID=UPI00315B0E86
MKTIEVKLKQLMKENNLTQEQLSEMTGIRRATISEISTNGKTAMNRVHLARIAEALEIDDIRKLIDFKDQED